MKRTIPTVSMNQVLMELKTYDSTTGFSLFDITFTGFVTVTISISGRTIEKIFEERNLMIEERRKNDSTN